MMRMSKVVIALLGAMVLLGAVPLHTTASSTYTDSVTGQEVYATSTTGYFAGQASGSLPGRFVTQVNHTPLSPSATITGGTFNLTTTLNGQSTVVVGTYSGGTVTL